MERYTCGDVNRKKDVLNTSKTTAKAVGETTVITVHAASAASCVSKNISCVP